MIQNLFATFVSQYDHCRSDEIWKDQSKIFKDFWHNKIRKQDEELKDQDMLQIIKLLDTKSPGFDSYNDEAVGLIHHMTSKRWDYLFHNLKKREDVRKILTDIFEANTEKELIRLIDLLYQKNGSGNRLSTEEAMVLNAFLFINAPDKFICCVSLKHRSMIMKAFGVGPIEKFKPYGERIIKSNSEIIKGFKEFYGIETSPRTLTVFLYSRTPGYKSTYKFPDVRKLWDI